MSFDEPVLGIVLAAGEGTRMRSATPKVLHKIASRTMLAHVLHAMQAAGIADVAVVIGPDREDVAQEALSVVPQATVFVQKERLGTAHAVLAAREALQKTKRHVLVAFGDTPLLRPENLSALLAPLSAGAAVVVAGFEANDPTGYGRLVMNGNVLDAIVEDKDANAEQKRISLCNVGLMALHKEHALSLLDAISNTNAKGEFYLTDAVSLAASRGLRRAVALVGEEDVLGVNDRVQLSVAEGLLQERLRRSAMKNGVTMLMPQSVYLSADTVLEPDVVIEPHVFFGSGVRVEGGAIIKAFSHLEGAHVMRGAQVGPHARLRSGTVLAEGVRIGNFVETKNAHFAAGAKANHLSYIGDAAVGEDANIGAGTITCNYDGVSKHRTEIGQGAFIGSNSALVAPVSIGARALVGAGSVITDDVPADMLALGRGRQVVKPK